MRVALESSVQFLSLEQPLPQGAGSHFKDNISHWISKGIVVTSAYSGLGTFEHGLLEVLEETCTMTGQTPVIHFYSVCEKDASARMALQHHGRSQALHRFVDV